MQRWFGNKLFNTWEDDEKDDEKDDDGEQEEVIQIQFIVEITANRQTRDSGLNYSEPTSWSPS